MVAMVIQDVLEKARQNKCLLIQVLSGPDSVMILNPLCSMGILSPTIV